MVFYQNDTDLNNKELMFTKEPFSCSLGSYNKIPYSYPSHWHDFIELLFVRKGYLRATLRNSNIIVKENELLVIMPGEPHSLANDGDGIYENFVIKIDSVFLRNTLFDSHEVSKIYPYLFNLSGGSFHCSTEELKKTGILPEINKFMTELGKKDTGYTLSVHARLLDITVWLLRRWNIYSNSVQKTDDFSVYVRMQPILNLINEQCHTKISNREMAEKMNMSVYYFCHIFKKLTGYSFHNYILKLRIDKAIKQLISTKDSVKEIAYQVGYEDTNYFVKVFKKEIGISPNKYRKEHASSQQ